MQYHPLGVYISMTHSSNPNVMIEDISTLSSEKVSSSRPRRIIVIIVSALAIVIVLCATLGIVTFGRGILSVSEEQAALHPVLDRFMHAMLARDTSRAYELFATRAQRQMTRVDLEAMLAGNNSILFDGYQSLTITSTSLSTISNTDPNVPQGFVATVSGTIAYTGEVQGNFQATLEKEGKSWRLDRIDITVPPSKALP